MKNFNELSEDGKLRALADSDDGRAVGRMIDKDAAEKAVKGGDAEAMRQILTKVLASDEGKRLAEKLKNAMK